MKDLHCSSRLHFSKTTWRLAWLGLALAMLGTVFYFLGSRYPIEGGFSTWQVLEGLCITVAGFTVAISTARMLGEGIEFWSAKREKGKYQCFD